MHVTETVALVAGHAIIVPVVDADDGPVVALQDTDRRGPRLADVRAPAVPGLQDVRPQDGEG